MSKLFKPFKLNDKLILDNHFVMAPMTTWSGNEDGTVSKEELSYYHRRSKEVGMVITATSYTLPSGKGFAGQFYAGDDEKLESLSALAKVINDAGAVSVLQIFHAGRKANPEMLPEGKAISASAVAANREGLDTPRSMTLEEIDELIQSYYDVVTRAIKAGFHGIQIHGANTYLLQQFVSPDSNRRDDQWGGSLEKRVKLPLKIIETCIKARKDNNRDDFLLSYRFSPEENYEIGITLDDTDYLVNLLCETELDFLDISLGGYKATSVRDKKDTMPILTRVHQVINGRKPLVGIGSIYTIEEAEDAIKTGCELVGIGRSLIIEPEIITYMKSGKDYKRKYTKDHDKKFDIPKPLHDVIIKQDGWLPME